jgi:hypothetical protein
MKITSARFQCASSRYGKLPKNISGRGMPSLSFYYFYSKDALGPSLDERLSAKGPHRWPSSKY